MDISDIVLPLLSFSIVFYVYMKHCHSYWKRKNFPLLTPKPFIGNIVLPTVIKQSFGVQYQRCYEAFKKMDVKYGGVYVFFSPMLVTVDPQLMKDVLSTKFDHFFARGLYSNAKDQPASVNLFSIDGAGWKKLRAKLSPAFSHNMVDLFDVLHNCMSPMIDFVMKSARTKQTIDTKLVSEYFTIDTIANSAFGINTNSFSDNKFYEMANVAKAELSAPFTLALSTFYPNLAAKLGLCTFSKATVDYFSKIVRHNVSERLQKSVNAKDFLQLLMDIYKIENNTVDMDKVIAQSLFFVLAGYEGSSTTVTFTLNELSQNLTIQRKVHQEIVEVLERHGGKITGEALEEMPYLQQVIDETIRKYPPLPILNRVCQEDYKIPGTDSVIEKGIHVVIPLLGLHRDPEYFPNPDKYDPDRFSPENRDKIQPNTYIAFGLGPRNCLGIKFALTQVRMCLVGLLKDFEFTLNSKTKLPIELGLSLGLTTLNEVLLDVKEL